LIRSGKDGQAAMATCPLKRKIKGRRKDMTTMTTEKINLFFPVFSIILPALFLKDVTV
jgi:hypothetical protein